MIRRIPAAQAAGRAEPFLAAPVAARETTAGGVDARTGTPDDDARRRAAVARALTLLLSEELRLAPEQIERVLSRELTRVRQAREIVVHVHPEDLALLRAPEHYAHALELAGTLKLEADAALSRGGCTLSSNLGEIDARLETRLGLVLVLLERGALI